MEQTNTNIGLTQEQVLEKISQKQYNEMPNVQTKSISVILCENIFTLFNLINFFLGLFVILTGSYKNALFLGIIFTNILIGSIQQIRSKRVIDKLNMLHIQKISCLRDGENTPIPLAQIVLGDLLLLSTGNQVPCDCVLVDGHCEVNESLITGESDLLHKKPEDFLTSGSFLVSGSCKAQVIHVGEENYINKITAEVKYIKNTSSQIMSSVKKIIKLISIIIFPIGILLFLEQSKLPNTLLPQTTISVVAALISMIPEGLVLLTSMVMAISVIRLSRYKTMVQELYSIEKLARVDVLCLDKTGTITTGDMMVDEIIPLVKEENVICILSGFCNALEDMNPTFLAIKKFVGTDVVWENSTTVPFSSVRKYSGVTLQNQKTYILGAPSFILDLETFSSIHENVSHFTSQGNRVLLLTESNHPMVDSNLPQDLTPVCLIIIKEEIRPEAKQTLDYFKSQGVTLKIISGDHPETVSSIGKAVGLDGYQSYIDATTLDESALIESVKTYTIFGRVTPHQKLKIIQSLKMFGHTVAMTGDGVNDTLALKEADCSIAMANGSDAARNVSDLVLLDSNFASMPKVVEEGRRAINNLQRSSSLYLTKTIYASLLALLFIFLPYAYPFIPIQLTLINTLTIGIPSFLLALEPNHDLVKKNFLSNVLDYSFPGGVNVVFNVVALLLLSDVMDFTPAEISTLAVLITGITSLFVLYVVSKPLSRQRFLLLLILSIAFVFAITFFNDFFSLTPLTLPMTIILIVLTICIPLVRKCAFYILQKFIKPSKFIE